MKIYAVRHAQTNFNKVRRLNDDPSVDVHLTEKGKQQAAKLSKKLSDLDFDAVYTSELPRTKQTAEIILNDKWKTIKKIVEPRFNDIRSGFDSQLVWVWFFNRAINFDDPGKRHGDNGESLEDAAERVQAGIDELIREKYENVLLVAHKHTLHQFQIRFKEKKGSATNADIHVFET